MKNLPRFTAAALIVLITAVLSPDAHAQTIARGQTPTTSPAPRSEEGMQLVGNKIYINGLKIPAKDAYFYALDKDIVAAEMFRRAAKIRGWDWFWYIYGGYNAGAGIFNLADGYAGNNAGAFGNVAIGGGLVGLAYSRELRRTRLLYTAVNRYNKALLKAEEKAVQGDEILR